MLLAPASGTWMGLYEQRIYPEAVSDADEGTIISVLKSQLALTA